MPWKPLASVAFAICTYPFTAQHPDDLPLQIGDCLYIIEQGGKDGDWYRGYLVGFPSLLAGLTGARGEQLDARVFTGIFPGNCVEVREVVDADGKSESPAVTVAGETRDAAREKRKSQAFHARRVSRALSRKKSGKDVTKKRRTELVADEPPLPRHPDAPKPLAPVPLLRVGDESTESASEPLVDEIASCLREWHDARLHELLLARGYSQLARVGDLIKRVDAARKQLMHDVMTVKELHALREDTVWNLVAGNKLLNDEVIVRSPSEKGRILTADDSVIEMTKLQANMSILDRPPKVSVDAHVLYHVLVEVRNLVCEWHEPATLQIYLCTKEFGEKPQPLSENFAVPIPLAEGAVSRPEDQPKSLFINLSANDVGIASETTALYVVFKLIKDEPVRQSLTLPQPAVSGHQASSSTSMTSAINKQGSVRGRRSVFGSQRKRADSTTRPSTATSELSASIMSNDSPSEEKSTASVSETRTVKRTVGAGAIDIGKLTRNQSELEKRVTLWAPSIVAEDNTDESDDWHDIVRELIRSPTGSFKRLNMVKRFDVFATAFTSSPAKDLETLVRNTPTLLHEVPHTAKLGFTGVPTEKRSDIYLTLAEPVIPRNAVLSHSKFGNVPLAQRCQSAMANLQLTLEVRNGEGERIEDCIFTASNHQGHTAWRTTAIEKGEGWNQTIKLAIPAQDVPGCHIVMSIADSPSFPFALAWVPLWESEAFVRDGDHSVALYVYDEYSSSIIGGKGAYLALPPWHTKTDSTSGIAQAATVSIRTYLCSTEYSQDPTLLGLLRWRSVYGQKLVELLERFPFIPGIEVMKLLPDVFQALFEILHEYAHSESYEDLVFFNFVCILSIAKDRRFNLENVVEEYAHTRRIWPHASQCLLKAFKRLLASPLETETSRKLRAALKVGDQLLKLIVETTKRSPEEVDAVANGEAHDRHPTFASDLQGLIVALMALMRNPMPVLRGTQTLVVQHFHTWLPQLSPTLSAPEIMEIATNLLDACAHTQGRMILHRLILIINYSQLDLFKTTKELRVNLVANTFRWLAPYWGTGEEVVGVGTEQWRDQVRLCCSVVATQMEELEEESCQYVPKMVESYAALQQQHDERVEMDRRGRDGHGGSGRSRDVKKTFSMLFPTSFPFPTKPTPEIEGADVDEAMLEMSALLAAALTTQKRLYFDENQVDIPGVLMQALKVGQSVLGGEAFPRSWLSLHVSHHRFAMTALTRIAEVLIDLLPDVYAPDTESALEFDTVIWRTFFDTLCLAVTSPALAMETFPEQKRRAIWKIAGDVRESGAALLRRTWDAIGWETSEDTRKLHGFHRMGGYQVQFVPELIAPVVELCLSVHAGLRQVAIEVLRTMIISTWELDQDLGVVRTAMIDCLDKLCRSKTGLTESYLQKTFLEEMLEQFRPLENSIEHELYQAVVEMFEIIGDLLSMLANVHQGGAINEATKIVDTLRLMEFLKDVQSEDAYIRYVHQLAGLQQAAGYHTEAGLALKLHADRYDWDPVKSLPELTDPKMPVQHAFERKEALYFEMCTFFERGQAWSLALKAYKELATQYEENVYDFSKLARCQRAMASVHEQISRGDSPVARYFRVLYRGLGFPVSVRGKEFVFEGLATDRMAAFEDRLQQLHPSAQIVRNAVDADVEGQFLQIFALSPHKDLEHPVYQRTRVTQAAREHSLLSSPQRFSTTTRSQGGEQGVPVTEQRVEKVIYTTADAFPTILRRSEIVQTDAVVLTPVEAALERTVRKTQELLALEKRVSNGEEAERDMLTADLMFAVDPNSESSVARYRTLLPAPKTPVRDSMGEGPDSAVEEAEAAEPVSDPLQSALKIALMDHALAIRRCLALYGRPAHMATKAELVPRFEASFEPELAILFPHSQGLVVPADDPPPESATPVPSTSHGKDVNGGDPPSTAGADQGAEDSTVDDAHAEEEKESRRRSRRSSLPWLRRARSTSRADRSRVNGAEPSADGTQDNRPQSRRRSHSRLRDGPLARRLSLFGGNTTTTANAGPDSAQDQVTSALHSDPASKGGAGPTTYQPTGYRPDTQTSGGLSSVTAGTGAGYAAMSTTQLKKRLSFLRRDAVAAGGV
ncbi:putative DOCK family protein [Teratosphaeria destructans]|uniref:DOCK family protein n=1 Tax=Teratosphaeria destructans TaxID=418781 RepID=A0A9W7SJ90_9PEZI|nr:putative DOCK family protein [Teratosphaeria destructans]